LDLLEESQASSIELEILSTPPAEQIFSPAPKHTRPIPKKRQIKRKNSDDIITFADYIREKG